MNGGQQLKLIIDRKKQRIQANLNNLKSIKKSIDGINLPIIKMFIQSIETKTLNKRPAIIAEIKKASPSKGIINSEIIASELAMEYEKSGASCISVLTEEDYFNGSVDDLISVKSTVDIPILRKDFIIDPLQIFESRIIGADCILLILSILSFDDAKEFESIAISLGMDVLLEVHTKEDIRKANKLNSRLIGINNRDLKTFIVNNERACILRKYINRDRIIVAESGIKKPADLEKYLKSEIHTFLIGEALISSKNTYSSLSAFLSFKY